MKKGIISTSVLVVTGTSIILGFAGYAIGLIDRTDKRVATVEIVNASQGEKIAKVEVRADNLEKSLERIEGKLDSLLAKQGIFYQVTTKK